jgi:hypothetical protein
LRRDPFQLTISTNSRAAENRGARATRTATSGGGTVWRKSCRTGTENGCCIVAVAVAVVVVVVATVDDDGVIIQTALVTRLHSGANPGSTLGFLSSRNP